MSSIFSPGDYFAAALNDFKAGKIELGVTRIFVLGEDPVPTVKVCENNFEGGAGLQAKVDKMIADIAAGKVDVEEKIG